jgi:hypothetical protein
MPPSSILAFKSGDRTRGILFHLPGVLFLTGAAPLQPPPPSEDSRGKLLPGFLFLTGAAPLRPTPSEDSRGKLAAKAGDSIVANDVGIASPSI